MSSSDRHPSFPDRGALMANDRFDLAVIGSGMAGSLAADYATDLGANVALIEKGAIGGT